MKSDLVYKIALTKIPKVGPKIARNLISQCGGLESIFEEKKATLLKLPWIGEKSANAICSGSALQEAEAEAEIILKKEISLCFYLDANFPLRLKQQEDAPLLFYYKGNLDPLQNNRTVAIVGTRTPTENGKAICDKLVSELKSFNCSIISGLAYGVDAQAHRKAVEVGIPTYGIMGSGFNRIYPSAHKNLAEKMLDQGGLITEFTYNAKPDRENFPMRNRIIAGLSDVVVVIESKAKGGSIITAEMANAYNKDVFAVPGRLQDEYSEGCNNLIKQHKANLIQSAADVAYIMRWDEIDATKVIQSQLFVELNTEERFITELVKSTPQISIDQISAQSEMSLSEIANVILNLEFKGILRAIPGKRYTLN